MQILRGRWRLFLSGLVIIVGALWLRGWQWTPGFLIAWSVGVGLYLFLVLWMVCHADTTFIQRLSKLQDVGRFTVPVVISLVSFVNLVAVLSMLRNTQANCFTLNELVLSAGSILLSWALVHTVLALHYAHEFYAEHRGSIGGLKFPGGKSPDYWDFIYFSFGIGITSAVSDVKITSRSIRKTVTAHSLASFIFNVMLIALTLNIVWDALKHPCR